MAGTKYVKEAGGWKPVKAEYCKIDGSQRSIKQNYVKIDGTWRPAGPGPRYIFVCEQFSDRLYCITDAGVDLGGSWPIYGPAISDPADVSCDGGGYSYWAEANNVLKLNDDGVVMWTFAGHACAVKSVAVDHDGYVYSGDFCGVVKKLDPATGAQLWSSSIGINYSVYALAVDYSAGFVYAGTGWDHDGIYRVRISDGIVVNLPYVASDDVTGLAVDEVGDLYIGQLNGRLQRWNPDSGVLWTVTNPGSDIHGLVIGYDGYGYYTHGSGRKVTKFNPATGAVVWNYTAPGTALAMDLGVDIAGNVYATYLRIGITSTENVVRKINSSGVLQWSWQPYVSAQLFGLAVTPGVRAAGL